MKERYFTVKEFAEVFKYSEYTIRKWIRLGRIHAFKIGLKEYRISESELTRIQEIGFEENMKAIKELIKE